MGTLSFGFLGLILHPGDVDVLLAFLILELRDLLLEIGNALLEFLLLRFSLSLLILVVLILDVRLESHAQLCLELWDFLQAVFVNIKSSLDLQKLIVLILEKVKLITELVLILQRLDFIIMDLALETHYYLFFLLQLPLKLFDSCSLHALDILL